MNNHFLSANLFALRRSRPQGFSLIEIIAAIAIVTVIVVLTASRVFKPFLDVKRNTCYVNIGEIEAQVQLWQRDKGRWPDANLRDIGADLKYFTNGVPRCPVDGSAYSLDPISHEVIGHQHN